ncbi:MAG: acyl-CoA dehydrogenase, partial [Myxococcota bacterium]
HYLIEGEKIFISFGEHDMTENIVHAVLARLEGAPEGTRGLSLFLVPKIRVNDDGSLGETNDVVCAGLEEKMGIHGSPTCTMVFGAEGKSHGWLLGRENEGIRTMFQMMNEARINVGLQGSALANAAYQLALAFAKERVQSKSITAGKDPSAKATEIINHPDVRQMLMWQKGIAEGTRALLIRTTMFRDLAESSDTPEEREKYDDLLGLLTPICKAYCSDQGFRSAELSLQTLGGYGYLREYGVEQHLRDNKIASIYEGTNGIQALDLVGRKLPAKGGASLKALVGMMMGLIDENKDHEVLGPSFEHMSAAVNALVDVSTYFATAGAKDPLIPVLNATPYLDLFGQAVVGWLLLEQATLAYPRLMAICATKGVDGIDVGDANAMAELCRDDEAKFFFGKIKVAQFWAHRALTQVPAKAAALELDDTSALEIAF